MSVGPFPRQGPDRISVHGDGGPFADRLHMSDEEITYGSFWIF